MRRRLLTPTLPLTLTRTVTVTVTLTLTRCDGGARGDACVQQLMTRRHAELPLTGEEVLLLLQAAQGLQAEQVLHSLQLTSPNERPYRAGTALPTRRAGYTHSHPYTIH